MDAAIDNKIAAYSGLVDSLAWKLTGISGAEFDDLQQEGMIAVWQTLTRDTPTLVAKHVIRGRMLNWCRFLRRLANNDGVAYDKLLAIELEHNALDEV